MGWGIAFDILDVFVGFFQKNWLGAVVFACCVSTGVGSGFVDMETFDTYCNVVFGGRITFDKIVIWAKLT